MSLLFALDVLAFEHGALRPFLETKAVLLVVLPSSFVSRSLYVLVNSITVSFVVDPCSGVSVSIGMEEDSLAECLVELPLTFVFGAICPAHGSQSMAHSSTPISGVDSSSLVTVNALGDRLISIKYLIVFEGLGCFISLEIFTLHLSGQLHEGIFTSL